MIISNELKEILQNIFKTFNTGKTHVISTASEMGHYFSDINCTRLIIKVTNESISWSTV